MAWEQPKPTKRFAVFYRGGWYGEGETIRDAWADARRQTNAACDPYGARLFSNIRHEGEVREVNAPAAATPFVVFTTGGFFSGRAFHESKR